MKYRFIGYNLSDSYPFYISHKGKINNRQIKLKLMEMDNIIMELVGMKVLH